MSQGFKLWGSKRSPEFGPQVFSLNKFGVSYRDRNATPHQNSTDTVLRRQLQFAQVVSPRELSTGLREGTATLSCGQKKSAAK